MKRNKYVDENGETINYGFEGKKPLLNLFFIIGTIIPLILVGFIIYTVVNNNYCHSIYNTIKSASLKYLKENGKLPKYAGDYVTVKMNDLYKHSYLTKGQTADRKCTGKVKVTKYEDRYIYTLDVNNCDKCSVNKRYKSWTGETTAYSNKTIIDVIPYYNLYDREVGVTEWSDLYEKEEISDKTSKYGIRLPKEEEKLPEIPEGSEIADIQKEEITYYRYSDKTWKWYDITGDYSDFYSEQPSGFANRDDNTQKYTEYTEYSLNYPEEHEWRTIRKKTGYKYYYIDENGKKVYANNGKYAIAEDIDLDVYTEHEDEGTSMYSYSDKVWRWYNGQRRKYSSYKAVKPSGYNYCDTELYSLGGFSSWNENSKLTNDNKTYRVEEKKVMTRYRYVYEILSLKLFDNDLNKKDFENKADSTVKEIRKNENYKLEVNYKFRYRNAK